MCVCTVDSSNTTRYSGTSIKRTPLGNSLLAVIESWVVFSLGGFNCQLCIFYMSHFLLQMNLGALLTASLAHTSFKKAVETSYSQVFT